MQGGVLFICAECGSLWGITIGMPDKVVEVEACEECADIEFCADGDDWRGGD